jgi:hypothetical protein
LGGSTLDAKLVRMDFRKQRFVNNQCKTSSLAEIKQIQMVFICIEKERIQEFQGPGIKCIRIMEELY